MQAFRRILKMDILNLFTNPMWVFYCIGFPLAMVLVLGFLTNGGYGTAVTSYDYYGISLMVYAVFNTATIAANSFMEERIKAPNLRIIYSPVRPFCIYFSKVVASFVFCAACYTVTGALLHVLVGVNYGQHNFGFVYILMLVGIIFCASLGVLLCCLLKSESATNQILSLVISIAALLGGVFFQVDSLGSVMAKISWASPAKWLMEAALQIIYDNNFTLFLPACGLLLALTGVSTLVSAFAFKGEEYL